MTPRRPGSAAGLSLLSGDLVSAKKPPPSPSPPPPQTTPSSASASAPKAAPKKPPKALPIVSDEADDFADDFADNALAAAWPEAVLVLSDDERERRVRRGLDSVLLDEVDANGRRTRGFVRVVLRVPLGHPKARVYGVFVEVDRAGYAALRKAFTDKTVARVTGRLATRLPFLDDAYCTDVEVLEDGSDNRARVVSAVSTSLVEGPQVGPRARRPS